MQGEQGRFTPQEAVVNAEGLRFAPPISAEKLLLNSSRLPVYDQVWFPIAHSPMHISVRELEGTTEYAAVIDYRADGWEFSYFTRAIAPESHETVSMLGTIDDWLMPDRPRERARLFAMHHHGLKGDWEAFEQSRALFLQTVALDPEVIRSGNKTLFSLGVYLNLEVEARRAFIDGMVDTSIEGLQETFVGYLRGSRRFKGVQWLHKSLDKVLKHIEEWPIEMKADVALKFIAEALNSGDTRMRRVVIDHYNTLGNGRLAGVDRNVHLEVGKSIQGELAVNKKSANRLEWELSPDIPIELNFLMPVIRWRKSASGERSWVLDFMDESIVDSYRQVLSIPQDEAFDIKRINPLFGLAVIPYFFPQLRDDWAKYQAIINDRVVPVQDRWNDGKRGQFMGAQASLVMALQHKEESLQTVFLPAAEEYVEKLAA